MTEAEPETRQDFMTRLRFTSWHCASLRFASGSFSKNPPRLASPRADSASPRLASLRLVKILHKFTFKISRILGTCATDFSVDELQWTRVSLDYLIQLHCLLSKQKIIATARKKESWTTRIYSIWFFILEKKIQFDQIPILLVMSSDSDGIELVFSDWYKETTV